MNLLQNQAVAKSQHFGFPLTHDRRLRACFFICLESAIRAGWPAGLWQQLKTFLPFWSFGAWTLRFSLISSGICKVVQQEGKWWACPEDIGGFSIRWLLKIAGWYDHAKIFRRFSVSLILANLDLWTLQNHGSAFIFEGFNWEHKSIHRCKNESPNMTVNFMFDCDGAVKYESTQHGCKLAHQDDCITRALRFNHRLSESILDWPQTADKTKWGNLRGQTSSRNKDNSQYNFVGV